MWIVKFAVEYDFDNDEAKKYNFAENALPNMNMMINYLYVIFV